MQILKKKATTKKDKDKKIYTFKFKWIELLDRLLYGYTQAHQIYSRDQVHSECYRNEWPKFR